MSLTRWWKWQSQSRALEFSEKWQMGKYLFKRRNSPSMWKEKANNILLPSLNSSFLSIRDSPCQEGEALSKFQIYLGTLVAASHTRISGDHHHPIPNSLWCLRGLGLDSAWEFSYGERIQKVEGRGMMRISFWGCFSSRVTGDALKSADSTEKLWPAGVATLNVHRLNASFKIENWNKYSIIISIKNSPWASS